MDDRESVTGIQGSGRMVLAARAASIADLLERSASNRPPPPPTEDDLALADTLDLEPDRDSLH